MDQDTLATIAGPYTRDMIIRKTEQGKTKLMKTLLYNRPFQKFKVIIGSEHPLPPLEENFKCEIYDSWDFDRAEPTSSSSKDS